MPISHLWHIVQTEWGAHWEIRVLPLGIGIIAASNDSFNLVDVLARQLGTNLKLIPIAPPR